MLKLSKKTRISFIAALAVVGSLTQQSITFAATEPECKKTTYECTSFGYYGSSGNYTYEKFTSTGHNCTSYIAWIIDLFIPYNYRFNNLGHAGEWAASAAKLSALGVKVYKSSASNFTPKAQYIAQWVSKNHVAFIEKVTLDKAGKPVSILVTEDNASGYSSKRTIVKGVDAWPDNFIDFGIRYGQPPNAQKAPMLDLSVEEVETQSDSSLHAEETDQTNG